MKKLKLSLVLLGMFCLFYCNNVFALEDKKSIIEFIGVTQDNKSIPVEEDGYVHIKKYDKFYIDYKINDEDNVIKDDALYYIISNSSISGEYYGHEIKKKDVFRVSYEHFYDYNKITSSHMLIIECKLKNDCTLYQNEETIIGEAEVKLDFEFFDEININDIKITLEEFKQGDKILTPIKMNEYEEYKIDVNDKEDIEIKLKGENLVAEQEYTIISSERYIFTGKELSDGVSINLSQDEAKRVTLNYELNIPIQWKIPFFDEKMVEDEEGRRCFFIEKHQNEEIQNFNTKLQYKNYKDKEIELRTEAYNSFLYKYSVNPKYHNKDNELVVFIEGKDYLNQDYDVEISITDTNNKQFYNKKITLNGLEINKGYEILLDEFTMEYPKELFLNNTTHYKVKTNIGNITRNIDCYYGYNVSIISALTYPNNQRAFSDSNINYTDYHRTYFYIINKDVFKNNDKMYMSYFGKGFENNITYEYELYYKKRDIYSSDATLITQNKISGLRLNTKGLKLEVENYDNCKNAEYILVIKKDGQIIQIDSSEVEFDDDPAFTNIQLESKGKNIYLEINNNKYIATKNAPLNVTINGIGFDDEKTYELPLNVKRTGDHYLDDERYLKYYYFTGYELNNGLAKVSLNSDDFFGYDDITVGFDASGEDLESVWYSTFKVNYVECKELFNYVKKYIIDNTLDLIKNIEQKTTPENFQENIEIKDNGSIDIYDKTGKEKVESYIGTGMIARVNNEYERSILDMDVVVKGDVTGDGKITITDMIKVRRHLAKLNELDGLYELAGDTTDKGKITITDLIKLRLDLANIAELK